MIAFVKLVGSSWLTVNKRLGKEQQMGGLLTWPNQYDQNIWTWPKNDNNKHELVEHDQKFKKNCHNDEHEQLNMTEKFVFGQVQQINVRRCHFSVMFKQIKFIGFGHIQTHFWSYWFGQVN